MPSNGSKVYKVIEDERFPTLSLDENDRFFYSDEECEEIPDCLVADLDAARQALLEAEDAIRAYVKTGLL